MTRGEWYQSEEESLKRQLLKEAKGYISYYIGNSIDPNLDIEKISENSYKKFFSKEMSHTSEILDYIKNYMYTEMMKIYINEQLTSKSDPRDLSKKAFSEINSIFPDELNYDNFSKKLEEYTKNKIKGIKKKKHKY